MYVKIVDNSVDTYPYTLQQFKAENSSTSFPKEISNEILSEHGVLPVTFVARPSINDRTQKTEMQTSPTLVDGSWTIGWTTSDKTSDETQAYDDAVAAGNRMQRNLLLAETDFYALSDVTMSSEMQSYRQSLRDITSHSNWPNLEDADWPISP